MNWHYKHMPDSPARDVSAAVKESSNFDAPFSVTFCNFVRLLNKDVFG